eukprot:CAMPEP_0172444010 /NCGR_PEP_ID=MMETSP1065-20121228/4163_1 /TAXON_ID=265537 /ORGANISM="Amphiprora paludosa, Strain CCMP125" /LENGTH=673 /DNA_ID=CAMNT_0013194427 /DNA_START=19 /DNA_END=2040 /DNA_ORIENTATION=+
MQSSQRLFKTGASVLTQSFQSLSAGARRSLVSAPRYLPSAKFLPSQLRSQKNLGYKVAGAAFVGCSVGQYYFGNQKDFYDYRFITEKDPDDLAGFYGSESFMDLFCVLPFMGTLMMRGGYFDDEGTVHTTGLPGEMLVSMVFSDEEDDDGTTKWFNKRERFRDVFLGFTCWDMVTNFGFEKLPDGRVMVYHHGEYFSGSIPPISLLVRLVFGIHARWVAWATEHHINHYAFQNDNEFDEHLENESREALPLFLLKNYAWGDLMAGLLGRKVEKPSFLIKKSEEAAAAEADEEDEDEEELEDTVSDPIIVNENIPLPSEDLPFQRPVVMRRITNDIHLDRRNSKIVLREAEAEEEPHLMKRGTVKQRIKMDVALDRHNTMTRKLTQKADRTITTRGTTREKTTSGSAAWDALASTNNPQAYKAATIAAGDRFIQRRATNAAAAIAKANNSLSFDDDMDDDISPVNQEEVALAQQVTSFMKKEETTVDDKEAPTAIEPVTEVTKEQELPEVAVVTKEAVAEVTKVEEDSPVVAVAKETVVEVASDEEPAAPATVEICSNVAQQVEEAVSTTEKTVSTDEPVVATLLMEEGTPAVAPTPVEVIESAVVVEQKQPDESLVLLQTEEVAPVVSESQEKKISSAMIQNRFTISASTGSSTSTRRPSMSNNNSDESAEMK